MKTFHGIRAAPGLSGSTGAEFTLLNGRGTSLSGRGCLTRTGAHENFVEEQGQILLPKAQIATQMMER